MMISQSQSIKPIISIWLMSLISSVYCIQDDTLELSCEIITTHKLVNGTHNDVKKIKAINTCAESYENEEVIKKCEHLVDSKSLRNEILFKPVINSFKNTTYWNKYCATCNHQTVELESWPSWSKLKTLEFICRMYGLEVKIGSTVNHLHQITKKFIKNSLKLQSKLNNSTELKCSMEENWSMNLLNFTIPCLATEFRLSKQTRLNSCQYIKKNGRICTEMWFIIEGLDFRVDTTGVIRLFNESLDMKFSRSEYTIERGTDNVIYLCEIGRWNYKSPYWIKIGTMIASIIFVIMYLILNFNKQYLQSFPNKIIYSYSLGLLLMYIFLTVAYVIFIESCVLFFLAQFSWFFHFFWTILISVEFCRLTYSTLRKRRVIISAQYKRYLIYCVFGYVLPTMIPVIYFLKLETTENQCLPIRDHFAVPCEPAKGSVASYLINQLLYIFDYCFTFFIPTLFLLQTGVLIYFIKCSPTRIRSTANRNHLIILMKMGYIMGVHWLLYELCFWHGYSKSIAFKSVHMLSELSINLQGVFLFFIFGFKKSMLVSVLHKCGCKRKFTQQGTGDEVIDTSVQFQSSSSSMQMTNLKEAG